MEGLIPPLRSAGLSMVRRFFETRQNIARTCKVQLRSHRIAGNSRMSGTSPDPSGHISQCIVGNVAAFDAAAEFVQPAVLTVVGLPKKGT